jgi:hypothetical protein
MRPVVDSASDGLASYSAFDGKRPRYRPQGKHPFAVIYCIGKENIGKQVKKSCILAHFFSNPRLLPIFPSNADFHDVDFSW